MGNIGAPEILVILVAALIILGPKRLPEAARQMGKAMAEFRRVSSGLQAEVRDAFAEPVQAPASPPLTAEPAGAPSLIEPVVAPPGPAPTPAQSGTSEPVSPPATPADSEVVLPPDDPSLR